MSEVKYRIELREGGWDIRYSTYNVKEFLLLLYRKTTPGNHLHYANRPWVEDYMKDKKLDFYIDRGKQMLKIHLNPYRRDQELFQHFFHDIAALDGKTLFTKKGIPVKIVVDFHGYLPWKTWPWIEPKPIASKKPPSKSFWTWFWGN